MAKKWQKNTATHGAKALAEARERSQLAADNPRPDRRTRRGRPNVLARITNRLASAGRDRAFPPDGPRFGDLVRRRGGRKPGRLAAMSATNWNVIPPCGPDGLEQACRRAFEGAPPPDIAPT